MTIPFLTSERDCHLSKMSVFGGILNFCEPNSGDSSGKHIKLTSGSTRRRTYPNAA